MTVVDLAPDRTAAGLLTVGPRPVRPGPVLPVDWHITRMARSRLPRGADLPLGWRWLLVLDGDLELQTAGSSTVLTGGDAVLVSGRVAHRARVLVDAEVVSSDLRPDAPLPGVSDPLLLPGFAQRQQGLAALVTACPLSTDCSRSTSFDTSYANLLGAATVEAWLGPDGGVLDPVVATVVDALAERPGDPWTVEAMSRAVHLSRSSLGERFRRALGRGPTDVLREVRMRQARRLLTDPRQPVERVAHAVGYGSTAAFSRAFSGYHGVGPTRWRSSAAGDPDRGEEDAAQQGRHAPEREDRRRARGVEQHAT